MFVRLGVLMVVNTKIFGLPGYGAVCLGRSVLTFQRNILPASSGQMIETEGSSETSTQFY